METKIKKNKKINQILMLFTILFLSIFTVFGAVNCDDLYKVVDKYYQISQKENYNDYIKLMDTDYIYNNLADEESYKNYVTSAFEVYDIEKYDIKYYKCNELYEGKEALVFLNLKTTLSSNEKNFDLKRDMVVSLRDLNGWKIQFVIDLETFSFHQNMAYNLMYLNQTKEILDKDLRNIEDYANYQENIEKIETEIEDSNSFFKWLLIIIITTLIFLFVRKFSYIFIHKVKQKRKKELKNNKENEKNKTKSKKNSNDKKENKE